MADVFLSHAREDRERVAPLAEFLEEQGWTVFWDPELRAGDQWREILWDQLTKSRCILVAWSQHSAHSRWVLAEADLAVETRRLVPVLLDGTKPPFGFGHIHGTDLSAWHGERSQPLEEVIASVREQLQPEAQAPDASWKSSHLDSRIAEQFECLKTETPAWLLERPEWGGKYGLVVDWFDSNLNEEAYAFWNLRLQRLEMYFRDLGGVKYYGPFPLSNQDEERVAKKLALGAPDHD